jgi:hypothetical protein
VGCSLNPNPDGELTAPRKRFVDLYTSLLDVTLIERAGPS